MDYSKIKVPYISNLIILNKANKFRQKYWDNSLPINIEKIIDVQLQIDIIPIHRLEKICNTDALITSNWKSLYIDKNLFDDERRENRLRFSLAHEIGHYVLHKDFYTSLKIKSFEDFYKFLDLIPTNEYGYLETQANKFAGYLLVARERLKEKLDKELIIIRKNKELDNIDKTLLKSYLAIPLAKEFGVSQEAMEIILSEFEI